MPSVDPEENPQQWVRENVVDALLALADPTRKKHHRDAAWLIVECIVLGQIAAAQELLHLHDVDKHGAAPDVLDSSYGWRPARNYEETKMKDLIPILIPRAALIEAVRASTIERMPPSTPVSSINAKYVLEMGREPVPAPGFPTGERLYYRATFLPQAPFRLSAVIVTGELLELVQGQDVQHLDDGVALNAHEPARDRIYGSTGWLAVPPGYSISVLTTTDEPVTLLGREI